MKDAYYQNQKIEKVDFTQKSLEKGEYENCIFSECNFSECDFSKFEFIDCQFTDCNLSLVKLYKSVLRNIIFINCKMLGIQFEETNEFGLSFSFENCRLNNSSFYKLKIKKTQFKNSDLEDVDFTECDLNGSLFEKCNLKQTVFDNTNIEKADFRTSFNYTIDPENNRIKKAKFSLSGIRGLLNKYDIEIE